MDLAAVASFFARHPGVRVHALGHAGNRTGVDLNPLGVSAEYLDAASSADWIADYASANAECFSGPLSLPGWVLVDLYLLPGVITLVSAPGEMLGLERRRAIWAAYCCVPTVIAGTVMGVSLLSRKPGLGAGFVAKSLGLAMHRAQIQRGITQWNNPALRVHTRFGPLRIVGPAPAQHGLSAESFVYEVALHQTPSIRTTTTVTAQEGPALAARAAAGEIIFLQAFNNVNALSVGFP